MYPRIQKRLLYLQQHSKDICEPMIRMCPKCKKFVKTNSMFCPDCRSLTKKAENIEPKPGNEIYSDYYPPTARQALLKYLSLEESALTYELDKGNTRDILNAINNKLQSKLLYCGNCKHAVDNNCTLHRRIVKKSAICKQYHPERINL